MVEQRCSCARTVVELWCGSGRRSSQIAGDLSVLLNFEAIFVYDAQIFVHWKIYFDDDKYVLSMTKKHRLPQTKENAATNIPVIQWFYSILHHALSWSKTLWIVSHNINHYSVCLQINSRLWCAMLVSVIPTVCIKLNILHDRKGAAFKAYV